MGLIDYGRVDWERTQAQGQRRPDQRRSLLSKFRKCWCANGVMVEMIVIDNHLSPTVQWVLAGPVRGFVFQVH
jgi:hypothetical protein